MKVVLRIGGSVVASPVNSALICKYADLLRVLNMEGHEIAVVVGGGKTARTFIEIARNLDLDEKDQDEVAISVSRIFAQLLLKKIGRIGCKAVPSTVKRAVDCVAVGKVAVMGGLKPGMTTDAVAALVAEKMKAELLVKATDQEGIYDKDPKKHSDAVKLDHLAFEELPSVFAENEHKAGIHQIIDPTAVKILSRSRVKVVVVNGFSPENVALAIKGRHVGTLID